LPQFAWEVKKNGELHVQVKDQPAEVKLWQATNPEARDFRLEKLGPKWTSTVLNDDGKGRYLGKVTNPAKGWTAYLVELTYPSGLAEAPFKFTTGVWVTPDTLPHKNGLSTQR
jgi:PhoPQ-activated pathogenicity-related protein